MKNNVAIIIPSRIGSTRFPEKPLAKINNLEMILHVVDRAREANITNDIFVATDSDKIYNLVDNYKANVIMTDSDLPSGTDRIYQAYQKIGKKFDYIINLQGDMPDISPSVIKDVFEILLSKKTDISTAAFMINQNEKIITSNIVKVAMNHNNRALYFSRSIIPHGTENLFHHIGIYGYTHSSLKTFVSLSPSKLELTEKLEQLRAIENDMKIYCSITNEMPTGVDVPEDILVAEKILSAKIK